MVRRIVVFCGLMLLVGFAGFLGLLPVFRGKVGWVLSLQGVSLLLMVVLTVWFISGILKMHREVRELKGLVCWQCGYCLHGLAEAGTCPECGKNYTAEELRRRWMPEPPR